MQTETRTNNSFKNAVTAFAFYALGLVAQFISRQVFIKYLGSEVLGLNSTATSLLQFLNMAELGVGSAVAFTLYKPMAEHDRKSIGEIVAVQGWLYRRIAFIVFISAMILSFFFPQIFAKSNLPLWYAYSTFGVLLFSTLLSYTHNYKQILLSASQQEYKVTLSYKFPKILKEITQIIAIVLYPTYGYLLWVILEGVWAIVATVTLNITIGHNFKDIVSCKLDGRKYRKKYDIIIVKIKQLLFHKVGAFILFQCSPLVIYAYTTLTTVAIYGNYMLIVTGLTMLLSTVYNGLAAGVGNLIHTSNQQHVMDVFREIYILRFILAVTFCFGFFICVNPLTILWLGSNYVFPPSTIALLTAIMFINIIRAPIDLFIQAKGIFNDIWAPIAEASINIGLSVVLGKIYGLNGILVGVLISLICIIFTWKPYYLFTRGLKHPIGYYVILWVKLLSAAIVNLIIGFACVRAAARWVNHSVIAQLAVGVLIAVIFAVLLSVTLYFIDTGMKNLVFRIRGVVVRRKKSN